MRTQEIIRRDGFFICALAVTCVGFVLGIVTWMDGCIRSAILVDSLPTEGTVRTVELGAAWDAMLVGFALIVTCAIAGDALIAERRRQPSTRR